MNIQPINSVDSNFKGKIITRGCWTRHMNSVFKDNPEVIKLASGEYNIIGRMRSIKATEDDFYHHKNEKLYKVSIVAMPEKSTILDNIKYLFGLLPKVSLTEDYHSAATTLDVIKERIHFNSFKEKLGI